MRGMASYRLSPTAEPTAEQPASPFALQQAEKIAHWATATAKTRKATEGTANEPNQRATSRAPRAAKPVEYEHFVTQTEARPLALEHRPGDECTIASITYVLHRELYRSEVCAVWMASEVSDRVRISPPTSDLCWIFGLVKRGSSWAGQLID